MMEIKKKKKIGDSLAWLQTMDSCGKIMELMK